MIDIHLLILGLQNAIPWATLETILFSKKMITNCFYLIYENQLFVY